jgi:hypothetical protein
VLVVPGEAASEESSSERTTYAPIATAATTAMQTAATARSFGRITAGYRR